MARTNSPTPEFLELTIDSLSFNGGRGVGRVDGMVVFVPETAPGDVIRARVTTRKRRFIEAKLVQLLTPSGARREAPCPVFGRCGGCRWQHVTYEEQARQKQKILTESLRRLSPAPRIEPFVPAPREFAYRNRIQVHAFGARWGYFAARSRDPVYVDRCLIAEDVLNDELKRHEPSDFAQSSRVEFARVGDGSVRVMPGARDPAAALFSQVNSAQNEVLRELITAWAPAEVDWFLDLYAGAGNFTGPLRARYPVASGVAIEFSRASCARGRLDEPSVTWVAGDVGRVLAGLGPRPGRGLILLDPPRAGCDDAALAEVARHRPGRVLYVSCDPTTFARDAERLGSLGPYVLTRVRGLDMFPQTEHVELIASFERQTPV